MQNLGHCRAKQKIFRTVGLKMDEKQAVTFALFFTFLNPQRTTLTYSAMTQVLTCWQVGRLGRRGGDGPG